MFPFFSATNGYVAARFYKFFNGTNWLTLTLFTSCGLPIFLSGCLIIIDICEYIETKKPIVSDILVLLIIWLCFNVPITICGSFVGFH